MKVVTRHPVGGAEPLEPAKIGGNSSQSSAGFDLGITGMSQLSTPPTRVRIHCCTFLHRFCAPERHFFSVAAIIFLTLSGVIWNVVG